MEETMVSVDRQLPVLLQITTGEMRHELWIDSVSLLCGVVAQRTKGDCSSGVVASSRCSRSEETSKLSMSMW